MLRLWCYKEIGWWPEAGRRQAHSLISTQLSVNSPVTTSQRRLSHRL